jgi:Fe2+ or Zn2+ uptake regulation protein
MDIENILKENKKSITKERKEIFEYIKTKHVFSSADILLAFQDIGRASIFRTIKLFSEIGIIRRVNI